MNRVLSLTRAVGLIVLVALVGPSVATACDGYGGGGDVFSFSAGCQQAVVQQQYVAPQVAYRQAFVAPVYAASARQRVQVVQKVQKVQVVERRRLRLRSPIVFRRERVVIRH